MGVLEPILAGILPVVVIAGLGYLLQRRLSIGADDLIKLAVNLLIPALVFDQLLNTEIAGSVAVAILAVFALVYLGVLLTSWVIANLFHLSDQLRASFIATSLFPNAGNMGLPLALFALGERGLQIGLIYFLAASVVMNIFGPLLFQGSRFGGVLQRVIRLPVAWAIALALVFRWLGWGLPGGVEQAVAMLGRAALPVLLITLGIQMARTSLHFGVYEFGAAAMRLLVAPALAWLAGAALGLRDLELAIVVIFSALPPAVMTYVFSREGTEAERTARVILLTTLLSPFTLAGLLAIFGAQP
jgi:hypothetical protein